MKLFVSGRFVRWAPALAALALGAYWLTPSFTQSQPGPDAKAADPVTSYDQISPVLLGLESFEAMMAKDKANKDTVMARQRKLLEERYDLSVRVDKEATMTRGKPIPIGPAVKL